MSRLSLTLGPLHFVCELTNGVTQKVDGTGQFGQVAVPVGVGVDAAGQVVGATDGASDLTHGHGHKVGRHCRLNHWYGLKCPDTRCEWGWGTHWPLPSEARS